MLPHSFTQHSLFSKNTLTFNKVIHFNYKKCSGLFWNIILKASCTYAVIKLLDLLLEVSVTSNFCLVIYHPHSQFLNNFRSLLLIFIVILFLFYFIAIYVWAFCLHACLCTIYCEAYGVPDPLSDK